MCLPITVSTQDTSEYKTLTVTNSSNNAIATDTKTTANSVTNTFSIGLGYSLVR